MKTKRHLDDPEAVGSVIRSIRGERVILDADLARMYGVETRVLKQAVRRNREKFPPDFLFELNLTEAVNLQASAGRGGAISRSQTVTLKRGENVKHRPFAFTEHGAIMAANILNSPQAVQMSVFVVRAFIRMRAALTDTRELARKLAAQGRARRLAEPRGLRTSFLELRNRANFWFTRKVRDGSPGRFALPISTPSVQS